MFDPVGKHDGRVFGYRYFKAKANHGIFVRPNKVTYAKEVSVATGGFAIGGWWLIVVVDRGG